MSKILLTTKPSFKDFRALMFLFVTILGFSLSSTAQTNIIPVRDQVTGFGTWTDVSVAGSTYVQLLTSTSRTTTPSMNFDLYTGEELNFTLRTFGGNTAADIILTVSVSVNGGAFQSIGTRTPINNNLLPQAPFDLSAFNGTDVRVRFSVGGSSNSVGVGIDDITITGIVPTILAPTVTTTTASAITSTSATLGGTVTATGGAAITANGSLYSLTATNAAPAVGGIGVTNIATASPAAGTGAFTNATTSSLDANAQYSYVAYATNSVGTSYGATSTFYTLANTPGTPVVNNATQSTLDVVLDGNANPDATQYAIQEAGGLYVQANGTLGATAVFQTIGQWGVVTVNGLTAETMYSFAAIAMNGGMVQTMPSSSASGMTLSATSPVLFVGTLNAFGEVCINQSATGSFSFDGSNLAGSNLMVASLEGFTYSLTENGEYTSTLSIPTTPTMTNQMVWVKFTPTMVNSYNGLISISGAGLQSTYSVEASGSGVDTAATVTTGAASNVTSIQATLAGSYMMGCTNVTEYGFEYSTENGFTNGTVLLSANQAAGSFTAIAAGLQPNTQYFYKAFATDNSATIYGNQMNFVTDDIATPVATDATAISFDGFTANWIAVPGATSYRIDVSTSETFGTSSPSTTTTETFDNITTGGASGAYNTRTWTGVNGITWEAFKARTDQTISSGSAITLRDEANSYLVSGVIAGGVSNISFDVMQSFGGSGGVLTITVLTGASYNVATVLGTYAYNTTASTYNSGALSISGDYKIRIDNNTSARPTIDNLAFSSQPINDPSFVIENADAGSGTSFAVTGLNENTTYFYRVRAVSANSTSDNSNVIEVMTIDAPVTFGGISVNGPVCENTDGVFTITGLVPNSTSTIEYNIGGGTTESIAGLLANGDGVATFELPLTFANNGQLFTITSIERTDNESDAIVVTENNSVTLEINESITYYADADNDGFGDAAMSVMDCQQPEGYVLNNEDCDDTNTNVNPNATEIFYNGIDDNCDGTIDEGAQITTQIRANQCGSTLSNIYSIVFADAVTGATAYRFKAIDLNNSANVQYFVSPTNSFRITDFANYSYSATYRISVEVQLSGVWLGYYGAECRISTPALALSIVQCGTTIDIYRGINSAVVQGATGYRFRVTNVSNPNGPNTVQVIDRMVPWFQLTSLASYEYNTTYSVEVAIKTTGDYTPYSVPCNISTKPWSALPLAIRQCGVTYTNMYSPINAAVIPNVSGYRFRFTNLATNNVEVISQTLSYTNLAALTSYVAGASYSVEVAVKTTGDYGDYGTACTINAPAAAIASNGTTIANADFKVVASPNPFSDTFAVAITEGAEGNAEVKVYDMIGKLLEVRSVQSSEISSQQLGNSYPSGVYNVIVTQGQTVKTLKVIKR